jgi:carboxyl-terminal processing protease
MQQETNEKTPRLRGGLGYFLAFVFAAGAFAAGVQAGHGGYLSQQQASILSWFFDFNKSNGERPDMAEFWRVWDMMEEKFVSASSSDSVSVEKRIEGAIEGLVDSYGDPYTVYLPPSEAERFQEDIAGNFSGVGMEVGMRDGLVAIIAPLPDTPAEKAGLLSGDVIVKIDDASTEGMRIDEAVSLIRGEKGTDVFLTIYREGETEFKEITVTRDTIVIPTIKTETVEGVFVIALYSFNGLAEQKMDEAVDEFRRSGAEKLVLDLRGNPGGYLQSAVAIAGHFLPSGKVVVKEQSGIGEEKLFRSSGKPVKEFNQNSLVVLIDGGSASASEILAGALRDHGVATVIGSDSFGKGSVQELVELPDGSSLKVTIARWLTPNGVSISDSGLAPNISIERTPADREADVDPQKDAAVRFLHGEEVVSQKLSKEDFFAGAGS